MTTRTTRRAIEPDADLLRYEEDSDELSVDFDDSTIVDKDDLLASQQLPSPMASDYDERLQAAQQQLQALRQQQEEIEKQKRELEDLNEKQRRFVSGRGDLSNKLSRSISTLEREASDARKRADLFDATREDFEQHFEAINALRPEEWDRTELKNDLARALTLIDQVRDDFDKQSSKVSTLTEAPQATAGTTVSGISSSDSPAPTQSVTPSTVLPGNFKECFLLGLAFTLPLVIVGTLALIVSVIF